VAIKRKEGPPKAGGEKQQSRDWFDYVAAYAANVAWVCLVLFAISLGYIIYAVYGGYLSKQVDQRIINNIVLMGKVLTGSAVLGTIAFAIATIGEVAYVVAAALIGLGLIFGTPFLILSKLQQGSSPEVATAIGLWTRNAGIGMCVVAGLRLLYQVIETIRSAPARRAALEDEEERLGPKRVKRAKTIYAMCWGLPYCHDTIREVCPAFKERKTCWKFGKGCNCDPTMVESLIRAGAARVGKGQDKTSARTQMTQDAYLREALGAGKPGAATGRAIECAKCPIYGEHQRQKFTIVNPIAIILTVGLMVAAYSPLREAYQVAITGLATAASRLAFENADVKQWIEWLNVPTVQVFFFAIVALFLLAYVLRIVEWAIFVKKI
jgi:hypothetical protein